MKMSALLVAGVVAGALLAAGVDAQEVPVLDIVEDVDFERPESWAMQYFGSIATLTPLDRPREREAGSVHLALEATQVPYLDSAERRVGFDGVKEEDLNRLPVLVRPRVTIGLPKRFAVEVGYVPPLRIDGIEPHLFSLAFERALVTGARWSLGARLYGQTGDVEGDLTCSEEDASHPLGSPENLYGCREASDDEATLEHVGLHLGAGYELGALRGSTLLFGAAVTRHDLEFQVDARTFGVIDRTLLRSEGTTYALSTGISVPATERMQLGIDLLWSPLEVVRPPSTSAQNDDLLHLRSIVRYSL